jgi:hypothetical protein
MEQEGQHLGDGSESGSEGNETQREDNETDDASEVDYYSSDDEQSDSTEKRNRSFVLSLRETEILKFLALVERGEGMSTAKAEDFLSYIKTFEDLRAKVLPKKLKTCWKIVNTVRLPMLFLTTSTIACYTCVKCTITRYRDSGL